MKHKLDVSSGNSGPLYKLYKRGDARVVRHGHQSEHSDRPSLGGRTNVFNLRGTLFRGGEIFVSIEEGKWRARASFFQAKRTFDGPSLT
jgi:hypothetical protein